jgi:hypothetical protein
MDSAEIMKALKRIRFTMTMGFIRFRVFLVRRYGLFDVFDNFIASVLNALLFIAEGGVI